MSVLLALTASKIAPFCGGRIPLFTKVNSCLKEWLLFGLYLYCGGRVNKRVCLIALSGLKGLNCKVHPQLKQRVRAFLTLCAHVLTRDEGTDSKPYSLLQLLTLDMDSALSLSWGMIIVVAS